MEAFTALDLDAMGERLREYLAGRAGREPDQEGLRHALREIVGFVRTFGPLGIGWGMTLPVENPEAERLERKLLAGVVPETRSESSWVASFYGQGAGRWGPGLVRRRHSFPRADLATRLAMDEGMPGDLGRGSSTSRRTCGTHSGSRTRSRVTTRTYCAGSSRRGRSGYGTFRLRTSTQPATTGGASARRVTDTQVDRRRFAAGGDIDWRVFARLMLSNLIGRQLNFVLPYVEVEESRRFHPRDASSARSR